MFRGLMFRRREKAEALLLFDLKKPRRWKIHSMFVFFPFVAIWLDEKGKIVGKEIVKPWTFSIRPSGEFTKLIEIPYNQKYSGIVEFLVGKSS
jgi:uncharacterized membrane protein (UPF0127 family)